jgi:hypothetical protein
MVADGGELADRTPDIKRDAPGSGNAWVTHCAVAELARVPGNG